MKAGTLMVKAQAPRWLRSQNHADRKRELQRAEAPHNRFRVTLR